MVGYLMLIRRFGGRLAWVLGWRLVVLGAVLGVLAWVQEARSDVYHGLLSTAVIFTAILVAVTLAEVGLSPLRTSTHVGVTRAAIGWFVLSACGIATAMGAALVTPFALLAEPVIAAEPVVHHIGSFALAYIVGTLALLAALCLLIAAGWLASVWWRLSLPVTALLVLLGFCALRYTGAGDPGITALICLPLAVAVVVMTRRMPA